VAVRPTRSLRMPSHLAVRRLRIRSILLRSKRCVCVCVSVTADRLLSICLLTYLFNRSITRLYRQFVGGGALLFFWLAIVVVLSRFLVWSNNSTSNRTSSLRRVLTCNSRLALHSSSYMLSLFVCTHTSTSTSTSCICTCTYTTQTLCF
jgi:hypothetical protein